jgi:hypothetical protein
LTAPKKVP